MNAQRIAGLTALTSGLVLVALLAISAIAGAFGAAYPGTGPSMMGSGTGMMGMGRGGMGPGMMGNGGMMGFGTSGPASTPIAGAAEVRVQVANFSITPSEIRLPKGGEVNLTLVNPAATGLIHDLTVPALGIHIVASAGEAKMVGLRGLPAGRYDAFCSVPTHAEAGMRATVIVD